MRTRLALSATPGRNYGSFAGRVLLPPLVSIINTLYHFAALTGGGAAALDSIDGGSLVDRDRAFCIVAGVFTPYWLNATSGAAESSPNVISPDTNAGAKRWIKCT